MTKKHFRLFAVLTLLAVLLAACGGAAGTGTTGTQAVPETGATTAPGAGSATSTTGTGGTGSATSTAGTSGGATGGTCVGVDTQAMMTAGQTLYTENCAGCHGAQGEGTGDFPGLAANETVTADDVVALVQAYFAVDAHPKTLPVEDLAGVLSFTRGSFGNTAAVICPDQITLPTP